MPSGFGFTRETGRERGNLYCAEVLEAMVIQQEAELKDKVTKDKVARHTNPTQ
jgi:hypothetical protein